MRLSVRGGLAALLVGLAALTMVGLGVWQLSRLQTRRAHNAEVAARLAQPAVDLNAQAASASVPEYQPVTARGTYDFEHEIVLRNRTHLDSPGVHVLTPLRLAGRDAAVLVDRGWLPYTQAEPDTRRPYQAPPGEVTVTGIARPSQEQHYAFLPSDPTPSPEQPRLDAWFWVNLAQIQRQVPYPLLAFYMEEAARPAGSASGDPLPIPGYEVDLSNGPHLSYAIQWFAFAVILVAGSVALARQRARRASSRV